MKSFFCIFNIIKMISQILRKELCNKSYIKIQMGKHSIENDNFDKYKKIEKRENLNKKNTNKKKNKFLRVLKVIGIIFLILILLASGVAIGGYLYVRNNLLGSMNYVEIKKEDIEVNEGVEEELKGYRTIALFGVDSREDELQSGTRSDGIILATVDQKNKTVKLVSVYRDTYLQISGGSLDKVTHAYAYGGAAKSISTLNTNLDLNITEFATVNFDSLVDIVDTIGGVQIKIEPEEVKYINDYITATGQIVGKSSKTIPQAGTYTLDGVQAVAYSRIRYTAGGDYKRTERMRTVLAAIGNKAKTLNITQLNNLAKIILPKVYTNISSDEIISMLPQVATYKISDSIGWPYEVKGTTIGGVWYGVPVTLEESVKRLHKEIYGQEDYEVSEKVKLISNSIINKTGIK